MELNDYIRILRKSWVLVAVFVLAGVAGAAGYSVLQKPEYSATAKVFVSTQAGDSVQDLNQGNSFTQQRVKTYADLATTPIVLLPVVARLDLGVTAERLAREVSATAPLNTTLIEISATSPDPVLASEVANAVSQSLTKVVQQIETPDGADATSPVKLTRVQDAVVPLTPISPNVPLNVALGLLVGLALGIGLAVLREVLDTRVRNERDVESVSTLPIIGGIAFDPRAKERPLIVHADPRSPRAESFRTLRTNLQFVDIGDTRTGSFVVTSSIEGEGKTTTTANLAIALADAGRRVLLIDADLRRPKVAEYMGLEGAAGLTDLLIGRAQKFEVIQPWGTAQLQVLPAGRVPPNPSELLGSKRMTDLVRMLETEFEYVLFDAPPLLPVTDAAILAKSVGGAIIVVAAGRTHKNQLTGAISTLNNVGAHISGFVLTMMPTTGPDAYGYGRYGYGYGYGYGDDVLTPKQARKKARASRKRPR